MEQLANPRVVACLRLAKAARDAGTGLSKGDLDTFADTAPPQQQNIFTLASPSWLRDQNRRHLPTVSEYLLGVRWLESLPESGGSLLRLSNLGAAVLRDAEARAQDPDDAPQTIVMRPDSAVDYATFVDQVSEMSDVLVVDRYAAVPSVVHLAGLIAVTRILTSSAKTRTDKSKAERKLRAVGWFESGYRSGRGSRTRGPAGPYSRPVGAAECRSGVATRRQSWWRSGEYRREPVR